MSKTKKPPKSRDAVPKLPESKADAPSAPWFRETVESIVIAFVLAFLFRTFEAEAFVIPTGSMAPTLMGRHKDVDCPQCGHRYQVTASEDEGRPREYWECLAGVCPMCRYTLPMQANLPENLLVNYPSDVVRNQKSYNGDRILVNKYGYTWGDPERWDIVVFHFPGDAGMNYIKRLVGLPGETLRVFQGDLFVKRADAGHEGKFTIERKPPDKVLAMRQLVHDTDYDPSSLYKAGWPLRWSNDDTSGGWKIDVDSDGQTARQRFSIDSAGNEPSWIRYRHFAPDFDLWQTLDENQRRAREQGGEAAKFNEAELKRRPPQLIMDFNAYNTRAVPLQVQQYRSLAPDPKKLGTHWVADLMVEADVDVKEARGELMFDLVKGGKNFKCTIDLATGEAKLSAEGLPNFAPTAKTSIHSPGSYRIGFANFDDQLLLFVKSQSILSSEFWASDVVAFDTSTAYDAEEIFGNEGRIKPEYPGDLAPAGVGARGAKLDVTRLQMWRDIYYIADRARDDPSGRPIKDHEGMITDIAGQEVSYPADLPYDPSLWRLFLNRRHEDFPLDKDQYFVMGDNSPESSDARLWRVESGRGVPGGEYLERRLLIGKALCVYWPHSWNRIPGTPIPFPLFPNFADMRLVR